MLRTDVFFRPRLRDAGPDAGPRGGPLVRGVLLRALQLVLAALVLWVLLALFPRVATAQRIKDVAKVRGIRPVLLTGIGLVVGLSGTGDSQRNAVLKQYYVQVLSNMGTGIAPTVADVKTRNAALVMVNGTVPSSMKPGTEFEVSVSSIGDADSLRGGYLLAVPMKFPYAYEPGEGTVHAQADGPLFCEEEGSGKISRAKTRAVLRVAFEERPFLSNLENVILVLDRPDFATASEVARKVNGFDLFRSPDSLPGAKPLALPLDSSTVRVRIPTTYLQEDRIVDFISQVLQIEVADVQREALVAIDRQKGSVVINGAVLVSLPAFIRYKGATIRIPGVAGGEETDPATSSGFQQNLLVDVVNELERPDFEFSGADVIHILQQMNRAGLIRGKFVER